MSVVFIFETEELVLPDDCIVVEEEAGDAEFNFIFFRTGETSAGSS